MPFTRNPLEYPINRLIVKIWLAFEAWIKHHPPLSVSERPEFEKRVIKHLGLDEAIESGLIKKYKIKYLKNRQVKTVWIVPGDKVRRTPGLTRLRDLFLKR